MLNEDWAHKFAFAWLAAWNDHDLEAILEHYTADVVFHSPRIAQVMHKKIDFVEGKKALAEYWGTALAQMNDLHFELENVFVGSDSLTITYQNHRGQKVAETFRFNNLGLVVESTAAYRNSAL